MKYKLLNSAKNQLKFLFKHNYFTFNLNSCNKKLNYCFRILILNYFFKNKQIHAFYFKSIYVLNEKRLKHIQLL